MDHSYGNREGDDGYLGSGRGYGYGENAPQHHFPSSLENGGNFGFQNGSGFLTGDESNSTMNGGANLPSDQNLFGGSGPVNGISGGNMFDSIFDSAPQNQQVQNRNGGTLSQSFSQNPSTSTDSIGNPQNLGLFSAAQEQLAQQEQQNFRPQQRLQNRAGFDEMHFQTQHLNEPHPLEQNHQQDQRQQDQDILLPNSVAYPHLSRNYHQQNAPLDSFAHSLPLNQYMASTQSGQSQQNVFSNPSAPHAPLATPASETALGNQDGETGYTGANTEPVIELSSDEEDNGRTPKRARADVDFDFDSPLPPPSGLSKPPPKEMPNSRSLSSASYTRTEYRTERDPMKTMPQLPRPVASNGYRAHQYNSNRRKKSLWEFQNKMMVKPNVEEAARVIHTPPRFEDLPSGFTSTWMSLVPDGFTKPSEVAENWQKHQPKAFKLTMLDISYFTISGLPVRPGHRPSSTQGLRQKIRQVTKDRGKAIFEKVDGSTEGRWKIPLESYQAFFTYLDADPLVFVEGIPNHLLQVASLGRARKEKGYPSAKKLMSHGVPRGLAKALAPFQRGGVDFVIEKRGRALVADEMGLGKSVQAIAGMSVYHRDWPMIILTPSSARYHWEHEVQHWLGERSLVNRLKDGKDNTANGKFGGAEDDEDEDEEEEENDRDAAIRKEAMENPFQLLGDDQVRVLTSSKEPVFPNGRIRVVICSYGLVPSLIDSGKIRADIFKSAIVDESHMLKNMATKRTSSLVPFLQATNRCLLLSGTPAFAKPLELWPQLKILSGRDNTSMWSDEAGFMDTYVKSDTPGRRTELHTMLTGTVMIRRLKADILKTLPSKVREKGLIDVCSEEDQRKFHSYLELLKAGKGRLGKLAMEHEQENGPTKYVPPGEFEEAEEEDPNLKRTVLNKLFLLTAQVKIPFLVEMVKKWIADPSRGKLCVFAHHLFVLDEIMRQANMSNYVGSQAKYIRIDGSTSPKERQAQIKAFQNDPTVRFAMLGITAAGVAVTLTACSTIWFTELFWTPALMIQAEDRCHRIGQLSRVKCMYFVARGTLDDLLWRLLEAKFRDLGEFVEGKAKLKMVVHRTYKNKQELEAMFDDTEASDDEDIKLDPDSANASDQKETDVFALNDLAMDFEEMGKEEMKMMSKDNDDEDGDGIVDVAAANDTATTEEPQEVEGATEKEPIMLSDDEDGANVEPDPALLIPLISPEGSLNYNGALPNCRLYTMMFSGQSYGMRMMLYEGRVVVGKRTKDCTQVRPKVADVLVAINGYILPIVPDIKQVVHHLRQCIMQPPVQLMFAHDDEFTHFFHESKRDTAAAKKAAAAKAAEPVIELLED